MPVRLPVAGSQTRHQGPRLLAAILSIALAATAATVLWTLPRPLVLPVLSTFLIAAAMSVALFAWRRQAPRTGNDVTYWDVAGALTLFGIVAALMSDPSEVIPILEAQRKP
ncbi:hypothetical protein GJW-30_1_02519 [Variibacter gotjawalensis]|uniref:Uncharacterized protein n=1 Tax=Variibacter gotjawalensis TaxID=1333996 RepID=A0A0S3PW25_9BRAD|nr:hypothetical protein [Variibacter gotjawalensis]NIK45806.1 hypothetical protein [Variibacter gotjawalensis]RZS47730.1 hypothetical protein EV661_0123 [Variibacter gotjawalensis]BAT59984.1 hypothetical protein GJW-30_1_02519 [Variibacter gotjawalensis]